MLIQFSEHESTCSVLFSLPFLRQRFKGAPVINVKKQAISERSATYGRLQHIPKHLESSVVVCKCLIFLLYLFIIAHFKIVFGSHQPVCQSAHPQPQSDHMNKHLLYSR